jgi:Bacterial Ig-like domain
MLSRSRAVALSTTVLLGSTLASGETAMTTVKALAAAPLRYANQPVTVRGRFRGRQPRGQDAGLLTRTRSRWDFLLEMDDAAVWVSGIRPAGWDFDLDPRSAADASRGPWLEVTGTFRVERRHGTAQQIWIEASDLRRAAPSADRSLFVRPASVAPALVFQDPIPGEEDVPRDTAVRLQFSRAILPETLSEHIDVSYASPRPLGALPIPQFTARYAHDTRSITLSFVEPLAPLSAVRIELLPGIAGANGLTVAASGYTFTTAR